MKKTAKTLALLLTTLFGAHSFTTAPKASAYINPLLGVLGNNPRAAAEGITTTGYMILIWNSVIMIGGMLVLGYLVWASIEWLTSGGDSGKLQSARNRMMHAVIGLLLLVASYTIIAFIGSLVFQGSEYNILKPTFITTDR